MLSLVLAAALTSGSCDGVANEAACLRQAASALEAEDAAREKALADGKARAESAESAVLDQFFDGTPELPELKDALSEQPAVPQAAEAPRPALPPASPAAPPPLYVDPFAEPKLGDLDGDGFTEAAEKELAQGLMPELEWAKGEPCGEHRVLYQFRPLSATTARVVFVLLFPVDCGFRGSGIGGHPGDVQEISVLAELRDGQWKATAVDLPWHRPFKPKAWPVRLYVSAGKHHIYPDEQGCAWGKFLMFDRCGGGTRELATLRLQDNVGERSRPLITDLSAYAAGRWPEGYAKEKAWGKSGWDDEAFCGGDPTRGNKKGLWQRIKAIFGLTPCADALDMKWDRDPTAE